jgi:hypothetical protein
MTEQTFPLLAVLLYRGLHFVSPGVTWPQICEYWSVLLYLALLVPLFLTGRRIKNTRLGIAVLLFSCSLLASVMIAQPPGTFERNTVTNLLTAWVVYLMAEVLLSRSFKECLGWGGLAACTYALLGLSWAGWLYLAPAMLGTAVLLVFLDWNRAPQPLAGFAVALVGALVLVSVFGSTNLQGTVDLISQYLWGGMGASEVAGPQFGKPAPSFIKGIRTNLVAGPTTGVLPSLATFLVVFLLVAGAVSTFPWAPMARLLRRRPSQSPRSYPPSGWSLFVLCWFVTLLAMVWPGKGYMRFYNQWVPFMPVVMAMGFSLLEEKIKFGRILPVLALVLLLNTASVVPELSWSRRGRAIREAVGWLEKNAPKGSVVFAHWEMGYHMVGFAEVAVVADPAAYMTNPVLVEEENTSPIRPPHLIRRRVDGTILPLDVFIPLENRCFGRVEDGIRWLYLDEDELLSLLHMYREYGVRIDYLVASAASYDPTAFQAWGYIRAEDILEWASEIPLIQEGRLYLSFSRENVVILFPDLAVVPPTYGVIVCRGIEGGILAMGFGSLPPIENTEGLVLLSFREMGKGVVVERAALCRRHPKPLLGELLAKGAPLPSYLKLEFTTSDGSIKILKVCLD